MAPFKSSAGRNLGKLVKSFLTSNIGDEIGAGEGIVSASGGTQITNGGTIYHVFTSNSPFLVLNGGKIDILLVAGGGSSSTSLASGGGAGGVVYLTDADVETGVEYTVVVGDGGAANDVSAPSASTGNSGDNSTFTHPDSTVLTALGGGYGAAYSSAAAANGGSGGGKETPTTPGGSGQQPSQSQPFSTTHAPAGQLTQYGNDGGIATSPSGNYGGGGGGAGGAGSGPAGGAGQPFTNFPAPVLEPAIPSPTRTRWTSEVGATGLFGGGGGGGARDGYAAGNGGTGGGGDGYNASPQGPSDGADYTGGGGGSGSYPYTPGENGAGGKGIVIIRYF